MYSKEERAGALGVYSMGIPLGIMAAYFITAALMGSSPEEVDWRRIFIFLGLTGIALAIVLRLVVREPVRGAMEFEEKVEIIQPPFLESLKTLLKIPAWWAMCFGIAFGSFAAYATSAFHTKFLIALDPTFNIQKLVIILGIINGVAYVGGTYFGAKLADRWGKKDIRVYGWLPAVTILLCLPIGILSYWAPSVEMNLFWTSLFLVFIGVYLGPSFAIAQTLAPIKMRAMSTALFFFILNMIALGGGPTFTGWLIDVFKENYNDLDSMRYAMTVTFGIFIPSAISFFIVSRVLPRDWEAAEKRNLESTKS
jgi:MFS family permease